ncbi:hypothetical protein NV379_01710 [Paenibacillus sp. N1-5-1-14]|uniref:TadE/TadG family type IV pilus assembly protein n=1 Tax=Paenibacillus radicibacter TaxID=2972488 RepID=UPI002158C6EB|nr:hypothetical protein [Paenibacillus radicibacter]MCR8641361.1 hypothetical protein [Paenibacillus radicibacter]
MKKRFFKAQDGAVTLYLVFIIVPIIMLIVTMIDYSRTKAAEMESEKAIKAGVRSVLSAFDPKLHKWGLYGVGMNDADASKMYTDVVTQNLSGADHTKSYRYLNLLNVVEKSKLEMTRTLGEHAVFKQQVLEEMKYRAPISFTLEIVDKMIATGASNTMTDSSTFAKNAEHVQKIIDKRENLLDEAWDEIEKMNKFTNQIHRKYEDGIRELEELSSKIGSNTEAMLNAQLSALLAYKEEGKELDDGTKAEIARIREILGWIRDFNDKISNLNKDAHSNLKDLMDSQKKIDELVKKASDENRILSEEIEKLKAAPGSTTTGSNTNATASKGSMEVNSVFDHVKIRDDEYFNKIKSGVAQVPTAFAEFQTALGSIQLHGGSNYNAALSANNVYRDKMNKFYNAQSVIEKQRKDENAEKENQKNANRKKIKDVLKQVDKVTDVCEVSGLPSYEKLEGMPFSKDTGLYGKYLQLNSGAAAVTQVSSELKDPDDTTKQSMDFMGAISKAIEGARDKLLINEFALTKYNYRTFGTEKNAAKQIKKVATLSEPDKHKLLKQEAEYLLYGFGSCEINVGAAYSEMFALRFAIRTTEALLDPKNKPLALGSPWLVLLAAAAEGVYKAHQDMEELLKGEAVEISEKLSGRFLTFHYSDYLRLFFLIHSKDINLMARMQALIELNTSVDLSKTPTYVRGSTSVKSSLWFVPGLTKAIGLGSGSVCKIEGRSCEITKTAELAYE